MQPQRCLIIMVLGVIYRALAPVTEPLIRVVVRGGGRCSLDAMIGREV
jgi:hypothetical protein